MSGIEPPFITIAEASRRIARRELSPVAKRRVVAM
jgi:hypothetical protein